MLMQVRNNVGAFFVLLATGVLLSNVAFSQTMDNQIPVIRGADTVGGMVFPVSISVDMYSLPGVVEWQPGDPARIFPPRQKIVRNDIVPPIPAPRGFGEDPLVEAQRNAGPVNGGGIETALLNQDGFINTGSPSDIIADVGREYYIQLVNSTSVRIFDKNTGIEELSFTLSDLAVGSGTGCTADRGDPVVVFDQLANRWVFAEFTFGNTMCFYVSQSADPTAGNWFIYEFQSASGQLPDYFKFGVWPDAYYNGANESFLGGRANYAFDRENMIAGNPLRPTQIFSSTPELLGYSFQLLQPADLDGDALPPDGAPGLLLRHRDDEVHNNPPDIDPNSDFIDIFEFLVDFDNSANSTFSGPFPIPVTEFDSDLCGTFNFNCVQQAGGGVILDSVAEPIMWRVQYRNQSDRQVMVGSYTVDVDGNDLHGVRWFVLERDPGVATEGWAVQQEGTYSLGDTTNRWLPSIAMDQSGNIAVGISATDPVTDVFPSVRYSGRLAGDPPGTLPRGEFSLVEGSAPNGGSRWGDYAAMSVDPDDDCTFFFSTQYNETSTASTRLGSFRFNSCGELEEEFFLDGFEDLMAP